jgi:hypothetical protein
MGQQMANARLANCDPEPCPVARRKARAHRARLRKVEVAPCAARPARGGNERTPGPLVSRETAREQAMCPWHVPCFDARHADDSQDRAVSVVRRRGRRSCAVLRVGLRRVAHRSHHPLRRGGSGAARTAARKRPHRRVRAGRAAVHGAEWRPSVRVQRGHVAPGETRRRRSTATGRGSRPAATRRRSNAAG